MLKKFFISAILVILTSFYLFPVSFSFLPEAVNSKMILAGFGIVAFLYDGMERKSFSVPHPLLGFLLHLGSGGICNLLSYEEDDRRV